MGNDIKIDLRDIRFEDVDWNHLAQDRDRSWVLVIKVINIRAS